MSLTVQRVILKRGAGDDGGAWQDQSSGAPSTLHSVLKSMISDSNADVVGRLAVIATGVFASYVVSLKDATRNTQLVELQIGIPTGDAGTTTNTVVQARVNGTVKATATIVAAATGSGLVNKVVLSPAVDLKDGDIVDLNVSTAPTGGTQLTAVARIRSVSVEI